MWSEFLRFALAVTGNEVQPTMMNPGFGALLDSGVLGCTSSRLQRESGWGLVALTDKAVHCTDAPVS